MGTFRKGHIDADIVAVFVQLLQVFGVNNLPGKPPGRIHRQEGIITQNLHIQVYAHIGHQRAHGAQADNAEGFPQEFRSRVPGLVFLHQFRNPLSLSGDALHPRNAAENIAGCHHQRADLLLLHRLRIGAGGIKDNDALFRAAIHRNVVVSGTGPCNGQQAVRKTHFVDVGAAQQQAAGMTDILPDLAAGLFQGFNTGRGNLVHGLYLKHGFFQTPLWSLPEPPRLRLAWRCRETPAYRLPACAPSGLPAPALRRRR